MTVSACNGDAHGIKSVQTVNRMLTGTCRDEWVDYNCTFVSHTEYEIKLLAICGPESSSGLYFKGEALKPYTLF